MSIFHNNALLNASGAQSTGPYEISRSLRFNSDDSAYLSRTPSSTGNRRTWTFSAWVKRSKLGGRQTLLRTNTGPETHISFAESAQGNEDAIIVYGASGGAGGYLITQAVFRDTTAWYHIVVGYDTTQSTSTNRIKIYINGVLQDEFSNSTQANLNHDSGINTQNAHGLGANSGGGERFDGYLADVNFIDGQQLAASDFGEYDDNNNWNPKEYSGSYGTNGYHLDFSDNSSDAALGYDAAGSNDWTVNNFTASVYTGTIQYGEDTSNTNFDSSASTLTYDTTGFSYSTQTSPLIDTGDANASTVLKTSDGTAIDWTFTTDSTDRYIWTSSNGTNWSSKGSYYDTDASPQTVNAAWVAWAGGSNASTLHVRWSDQSPVDSVIDTPTNYEADSGNNGGNYCVLNSINKGRGTLSEAGLKWQTGNDSSNNTGIILGTMAVSSGKWYWEVKLTASTGTGSAIGIADETHEVYPNSDGQGLGTTSGSYAYLADARKYNNGAATSYGNNYTVGDTIGVALDMDNGTLTFYKNGTSQGQAYSGLSGTFFPALSDFNNQQTWTINFGQQSFENTPPTNHLSLCTANLGDPSVADGSTAFDVYTYGGTGSEQAFSSIFSFQPDLVWIKKRTGTPIRNHSLHNRISGVERTLQPNDSGQEEDDSQGLKAFGSTGFTVGTEGRVNESGGTYVSWAWYAGGGSAASNTDGTISGGSEVLANQDAGISIVKWSGSNNNKTVGHGLGTTPELIILKDLDTSRAWYVGSKYVGNNWGSYLRIDGIQGIQNNSDVFSQGGQPSSTVFGVGAEGNPTGNNLALCFASKEGFSKIGVIHGTGETNGPLVYTGFRPAFIIIKPLYNYSGGDQIIQNTGWYMYDSTRSPYNGSGDVLGADRAQNEENNSTDMDLLSNGFKMRNNRATNTTNNALFLAFAEHPFKTARAR